MHVGSLILDLEQATVFWLLLIATLVTVTMVDLPILLVVDYLMHLASRGTLISCLAIKDYLYLKLEKW